MVPKEFAAVVDAAVTVTVEREKAAAAGGEVDAFLVAVGIEVEGKTLVGELRGVAVEVDDQRVLRLRHVAKANADVRFLVVAAAHRERQRKVDLPAVGGVDHAARCEARLFAFAVLFVARILDSDRRCAWCRGAIVIRRRGTRRLRLGGSVLAAADASSLFVIGARNSTSLPVSMAISDGSCAASGRFSAASIPCWIALASSGCKALPDSEICTRGGALAWTAACCAGAARLAVTQLRCSGRTSAALLLAVLRLHLQFGAGDFIVFLLGVR